MQCVAVEARERGEEPRDRVTPNSPPHTAKPPSLLLMMARVLLPLCAFVAPCVAAWRGAVFPKMQGLTVSCSVPRTLPPRAQGGGDEFLAPFDEEDFDDDDDSFVDDGQSGVDADYLFFDRARIHVLVRSASSRVSYM